MFTGLIEEVGAVSRRSGPDLAIVAEVVMEGLQLGDSVAVNGACLTVAALLDNGFVAQVSPETYAKTALGTLQPGHAVNLERAMHANGRFGGHMVLGHVDGVGKVEAVRDQGGFALWRFRAPETVAKYLIPKGSVTIDGISLTVVDPVGDAFDVAVIPTTLEKTTLSTRGPGDPVNMEADMVAKHIFHFMQQGNGGGLTIDTLSRHGFA